MKDDQTGAKIRREQLVGDRLPDFVIIGAVRSGTTSLHRYLGAHPEVFLPVGKELHFFDRHYENGLDWYRSRFAAATTEQVCGEATPGYMYDGAAMYRMAHDLPRARLVAVLRNPIDRAYSQYWRNRSLGREPLSFEEAIAVEPNRLQDERISDPAVFAYLDRGRYLRQLLRVTDLYRRADLDIVLFDDLVAQPSSVFRSLCEFLGVDPNFSPAHLGEPTFSHWAPRSRLVMRINGRLPGRLRPLQKAISHVNTAHTRYEPMAADTRAALVRRFRSENDALGEWLHRDLSTWNE